MKFKLSPFIILFFLLNSILIFCAFTKIDSEQKPASETTVKNTDAPARPHGNLDPHADATPAKKIKTQLDKAPYDGGHTNKAKTQEDAKAIMGASAKDDFVEGSAEQKIESAGQSGISRLLPEHIKIDAIDNYTIVAIP